MLESQPVLLDAGMLIGTLLRGDLLHSEARPLVEAPVKAFCLLVRLLVFSVRSMLPSPGSTVA